MIIAGLQKTSLVDWPGKICSVIFLAGCNMKCGFCHNSELVLPKLIKEQTVPMHPEDVLKQIDERLKFIDGVCISGGEPTINRDIIKLCEELKKRKLLIKLDTNGLIPKALKLLLDFNLVDYVAMDIKGPKEKYSEICGTNINMEEIEKSIEILKQGKVDYEFRTTVVKGMLDLADIVKIGEWLKGSKAYYLQQYNIHGKTLDKKYEGLVPYTPDELKEMETAVKEKFDKTAIRGI